MSHVPLHLAHGIVSECTTLRTALLQVYVACWACVPCPHVSGMSSCRMQVYVPCPHVPYPLGQESLAR